jgi:N-methylhydantoinase A
VTQSNGGVLVAGVAAERGVDSVRSGPASGVVAAAHLGSLCEAPDVIGVDMGGTSYDVSLIRGSTPQLRTDTWVGRYRVALPVLDIHAIGAGGGSIGWLDGAGALRVGPRSAGAEPGPACYSNRGIEPTVTDANLILGYLSSSLLGGELELDRGLAAAALEQRLAGPLGTSVDEAAAGMLRVINNTMNNGVRYISVARGHDPRDFTLMAFGGAGAIHAAMQARDLGISRVLVPKDASVFCALGALTSDVKVSLIHPYYSRGSEAAVGEMERIFGTLRKRAEVTISHAGEELADVRHRPFIDARYMGQTHEVTVPIDVGNGSLGEAELRQGIARFHDMHEQLYSFKSPEQDVELINLRYDLIGVRDKPDAGAGTVEREVDPEAALRDTRSAYFEIDGRFERVDTPVFDGGLLRPGNTLNGPCVIEEPHTTIVVCPGQTAALTERLVYDIDVGAPMGGDR